jgi:L-amino acid N-acyltransferase YncA
MLLRHAEPHRDGAGCAAVYAPYVSEGVASLEETAPTPQEMSERIERHSARHPWLVAEAAGEVLGYAYGSRHHERCAYRWAADVAVYVGARHHRRGVGRALYGALLPLLARQGMYVVCAGVTLPNDASVALHESVGFKPVGVYRRVGWKFGAWWDVGWWQLQLRPADRSEPPAEPGPPARLNEPAPAA